MPKNADSGKLIVYEKQTRIILKMKEADFSSANEIAKIGFA